MPAATYTDDDFITVKDCYTILRIGRRQMYDMLRDGNGPVHRRFGRRYRIRYKNFMTWASKPKRKRNGHV
jgi:excisionase family DNA binding protein